MEGGTTEGERERGGGSEKDGPRKVVALVVSSSRRQCRRYPRQLVPQREMSKIIKYLYRDHCLYDRDE